MTIHRVYRWGIMQGVESPFEAHLCWTLTPHCSSHWPWLQAARLRLERRGLAGTSQVLCAPSIAQILRLHLPKKVNSASKRATAAPHSDADVAELLFGQACQGPGLVS